MGRGLSNIGLQEVEKGEIWHHCCLEGACYLASYKSTSSLISLPKPNPLESRRQHSNTPFSSWCFIFTKHFHLSFFRCGKNPQFNPKFTFWTSHFWQNSHCSFFFKTIHLFFINVWYLFEQFHSVFGAKIQIVSCIRWFSSFYALCKRIFSTGKKSWIPSIL